MNDVSRLDSVCHDCDLGRLKTKLAGVVSDCLYRL